MMKKKRTVNKYPKAFRKMAMERLKSCESVTALSEELGIHRTLLYKWRDQMEAVESKDGPARHFPRTRAPRRNPPTEARPG